MTKLPYNPGETYTDLIEDILVQMVEKPDEIDVCEVESNNGEYLSIEINAAKDDRGKIIGRQGKTIAALTTIIVAMTEGRKVRIDVNND